MYYNKLRRESYGKVLQNLKQHNIYRFIFPVFVIPYM